MKACIHYMFDNAYGKLLSLSFIIFYLSFSPVRAQTEVPDSIVMALDSIYQSRLRVESLELRDSSFAIDDSLSVIEQMSLNAQRSTLNKERDWSTWRPDPQRALWLALVIPGGGQIYNRKYWKLPIVYGGFVGCIYAMMWNNMMYKDYSQAYLDIMDDDPGTASYNKFLHLGRQITPANEDRYKEIFKKRKDRFRRYRDLSFFVMLGVYAISVIDAYVDAELSVFDISKDLSLKLRPAVINGSMLNDTRSLANNAIGVNCVLDF